MVSGANFALSENLRQESADIYFSFLRSMPEMNAPKPYAEIGMANKSATARSRISSDRNLPILAPMLPNASSYESRTITIAVGMIAAKSPSAAKPTCPPQRCGVPSFLRSGRREEKAAPKEANGMTMVAFSTS